MSPPNILVVSFGGVGSKFLLQSLYPGHSVAFYRRHHTHSRSPGQWTEWSGPIVYLYGDPREAIASLFQRRRLKHGRHDYQQKEDWIQSREADRFVQIHLENLEVDPTLLRAEWDLQDYLQHTNHDLFRLEDHVDAWLHAPSPIRPLFLRFDTLWDHEATIAKALGMEAPFLGKKIERMTKLEQLPGPVYKALNDRYQSLVEKLATLPPVYLPKEKSWFP